MRKNMARLVSTTLIALLAWFMLVNASAVHPEIPRMPSSLLMVNVGTDVIRAGLSLTRIGIADMGDQYTIGGTFVGHGKSVPSQVTLHMITSTGKSVRKSGALQSAPLGMYAFLVLIPKEDGEIKVISITGH